MFYYKCLECYCKITTREERTECLFCPGKLGAHTSRCEGLCKSCKCNKGDD